MTLKHWLCAAAAAATASFLAFSAEAAGIGSATDNIKSATAYASSVEKVAYRRCWRRHHAYTFSSGRRHLT